MVITYDNQVLLVQNWIGPGRWELPGGGIKFGESTEDAAIREIREELHLHIEDVRKLSSQPITVKKGGIMQRVEYLQAAISPDDEIVQNWEIAKVSWLPIGELETARVMPPSIRESVTSSAALEDDTL